MRNPDCASAVDMLPRRAALGARACAAGGCGENGEGRGPAG